MKASRRKFARVAWPLVATYRDGRQTRTARALDVSDGGALLSVNESVNPGTELEVQFYIDEFDLEPQRARVVRNGSAFGGSELLIAVEFERPHPGLASATEFDREKTEWRNSRILQSPRKRAV